MSRQKHIAYVIEWSKIVLGGETFVGKHSSKMFLVGHLAHSSLQKRSKSFRFIGCHLTTRSSNSYNRLQIGLRCKDGLGRSMTLICCFFLNRCPVPLADDSTCMFDCKDAGICVIPSISPPPNMAVDAKILVLFDHGALSHAFSESFTLANIRWICICVILSGETLQVIEFNPLTVTQS